MTHILVILSWNTKQTFSVENVISTLFQAIPCISNAGLCIIDALPTLSVRTAIYLSVCQWFPFIDIYLWHRLQTSQTRSFMIPDLTLHWPWPLDFINSNNYPEYQQTTVVSFKLHKRVCIPDTFQNCHSDLDLSLFFYDFPNSAHIASLTHSRSWSNW